MNIKRLTMLVIGISLIALCLVLALAVAVDAEPQRNRDDPTYDSVYGYCIGFRGISPFGTVQFADCVDTAGDSYGWCMEELVPRGATSGMCADGYLETVSQCQGRHEEWMGCVADYHEAIAVAPSP